MKQFMDSKEFWNKLNELIDSSEIIIDRKKGSNHPVIKEIIYPVDYGFINGTKSNDNEGIDIWIGSEKNGINGIVCTIDSYKKDSEIKVLYNCSKKEIELIFKFSNERDGMKGILLLNNT